MFLTACNVSTENARPCFRSPWEKLQDCDAGGEHLFGQVQVTWQSIHNTKSMHKNGREHDGWIRFLVIHILLHLVKLQALILEVKMVF